MSRVTEILEKLNSLTPRQLALHELKNEWDGREVQGALFQVLESNKGIVFIFSIPFSRTTYTLAYQSNKQLIDYCNRVLDEIAKKYSKDSSSSFTQVTKESVAELDKEFLDNKKDPYSEDQRVLEGSVRLSFRNE